MIYFIFNFPFFFFFLFCLALRRCLNICRRFGALAFGGLVSDNFCWLFQKPRWSDFCSFGFMIACFVFLFLPFGHCDPGLPRPAFWTLGFLLAPHPQSQMFQCATFCRFCFISGRFSCVFGLRWSCTGCHNGLVIIFFLVLHICVTLVDLE